VSLPAGACLPAEFAPHERTLIAWPTERRRVRLWGDRLDAARDAYAVVARAVAAHEPVLLVVDPDDTASARSRLDAAVEVVELPIDDSWLRDSGPVVVVAPEGTRHAVQFQFNAWGGKYAPIEADRTIATRLAQHLGLPVHRAPLVLEGGAVAADGQGRVVTTERCLLNRNRNPHLDRAAIEAALRTWLGATSVIWLPDGIAEDDETDGHVDNVVAWCPDGRVLLQGCVEPGNPNAALARANRAILEECGLTVVELTQLPYVAAGGARGGGRGRVPVPYANLYVANGVVVVPVTGHAYDAEALALIAGCFPGRDVVGVEGAALAAGGGGPHCITQQVPA
jgi:agmatine deiminase